MKEIEKIEKYAPLVEEMKEVWKQHKISIVPIVMSVTGITTKSFAQYLKTIELQPIYTHTNIQKAVILQKTSLVKKCLQYKEDVTWFRPITKS